MTTPTQKKVDTMWRGRPGLSLPLVLIVVALGMAFTGVALYLLENYQATSRSSEVSQRLYNAAQEGIERGKIWIDVSVSRGVYPRWSDEDGDGLLQSPDLAGTSVAKVLTAWGEGANGREEGHWRETIDDIDVEVRVFDVVVAIEPGFAYDPDLPVLLREVTGEMEEGKLGQSYGTANQSEGSVAGSMTGSSTGRYIIRSTARLGDRKRSLEAAAAVR